MIDHQFIKIPRVLSTEKLVYPPFDQIQNKDTIQLRPNQISTGEKYKGIFETQESFDGIIVRDTAFGKTIIALYFFTLYKKKTLIVVNRLELMKQWETKIKKFLPNTTIGRIQGAIFDIKDITLATVQTLTVSKRKLEQDCLDCFYCSFFDEIHLFSSDVFSKILYKINSPFRIGLTATLERKDNKQELLKMHLPCIDSNVLTNQKQSTKIHIIPTKTVVQTIINDSTGKINYSRMVTNLTCDSKRNAVIIKELEKYVVHVSRKIIVMSDRLDQLKYLMDTLNHESSQLFTGGSRENFDPLKKVTFATYQLAGVGFDLPELNTLLFASPRSDIQQIIGRIYRKTHKNQPIIIDFKDSHFVFIAQLRKRVSQYKKFIKNPEFSDDNTNDTPRFLDDEGDDEESN